MDEFLQQLFSLLGLAKAVLTIVLFMIAWLCLRFLYIFLFHYNDAIDEMIEDLRNRPAMMAYDYKNNKFINVTEQRIEKLEKRRRR